MADVRDSITTAKTLNVGPLLILLPLLIWFVPKSRLQSTNWYSLLVEYRAVPLDRMEAFLAQHLT